jgi:hypothetical protein
MPLARIRTQLSAVPPELERRLASCGYEVEIASSGDTRSRPADLEITLNSRPTHEFSSEAAEFDGNVYVSPQSLQKIEVESEQIAQPVQSTVVTRYEEAPPSSSLPEPSQAERELRQRIEREQVNVLLANMVAAKQAQAEADSQELKRAEERRLQMEVEERDRLQEQRRQSELLRVEREREAQRLVELREAQAREAHIRAEEQRKYLAEQERLRAELARKDEELRTRERQWQAERERFERERLERERIAAVAITPAEASSNVVPITSASVEPPTPVANEIREPQTTPADQARQQLIQLKEAVVRGGSRRLRHKEYRRAAATAAALTGAIMFLWITLSTRGPADPLTTPALVKSNQVQQKTPFGAAAIAAPVQIQQRTAAAPSIAAPRPVPTKVNPKPSPVKKSTASRRARTADDSQEVVVRHFGSQKPNASNSKVSKNGVKVISDLD